jgi:hypothetical protein
MSTGYFRRQFNTQVSADTLIGTLNLEPKQVSGIELLAAISSPPALAIVANTYVNLSNQQLVQAAIATQLIDPSAATGPSALNFGPDASTQASQYIQLFNLRSTNDVRVLRFASTSTGFANTILSNTSATGASAGTYVKILLDGAAATNATGILFGGGPIISTLSTTLNKFTVPFGGPGTERVVLVSASTLTSGSEVVNFNILSASL